MAEKHGLQFLELIDSRATTKLSTKRVASIDLIERGIELHFPGVLFYRHGKLQEVARTGYDHPWRLEEFLLKKVKEGP